MYFDKNIQGTSFDLRPELPLEGYFDVFERPLNTSEPLINPHLKNLCIRKSTNHLPRHLLPEIYRSTHIS